MTVAAAPLPDGTPAPLGDPVKASSLLAGFDEKMTLESRDIPPATPPKTDPDAGKAPTPPPAPEKPVAPPKNAPTATPAPKISLANIPAELKVAPAKPGEAPPPATPPAPSTPATTMDPEKDLDEIEKTHKGAVNAELRLKFKGYKAEIDRLAAAAQARSTAPAAEVKIEDNPTFKELQQRAAAAEDQVGRMNIQAHPRYQAQLVKPEQDLIKQGKEVLKAVNGPEDLVERLIDKSLADRIKIIDEEATPAKALLIPLLRQIDQIREVRNQVDARHKETMEKWQTESRMQAAQRDQQIRTQLFEQSVAVRAQAGDILLRELPGQEEWNKSVNTVKEMAKALIFTDKVELQAEAFVKAAQFDSLQEDWHRQNGLIRELQAEIEAMTRGTPGIRSERGSSSPTPPAAPVDSQSAGDAASDILRGLVPAAR